jgi:hypothetical protein
MIEARSEGTNEMLSAIIKKNGETFAHDPNVRGYHAVYREHQVNHCPGCGRTHWYVGRMTAECGFCATALPLAEANFVGGGLNRTHGHAWRVEEAA